MKKYFTEHNEKMCCEYPTKCPICDNSISPDRKAVFHNLDLHLVSMLFSCPACGKGFLSYYNSTGGYESHDGFSYICLIYNASFPMIPKERNFDDCIKSISPNFCDVYNQSYYSECYKLTQLSGMGYRKSLEFLIKDYCSYKNSDDADKIKSMLLSQVIEEYIESEKIKTLSKISTWLGNDETHYVKKFEDRDIEDLKKFINATVAFITYELIAEEAAVVVESKQ